MREITGQELLRADDQGLVSVTVNGKLQMTLQFSQATGRVLCFVEIAQIPPNAPVKLYQHLLAAGLFGQETAGGYFSLEETAGTVVYNCVLYGEELISPEEFITQLENILQVCEIWEMRIEAALHEQSEASEQNADVLLGIPV